jgi:hypothetical protein
MARTAIVAAMFGAFVLGSAPAAAAPVSEGVQAMSEFSSQARSRPRLRVRPGRLLYRECNFRLVQQRRPDGTFLVPRQRCWWVRG